MMLKTYSKTVTNVYNIQLYNIGKSLKKEISSKASSSANEASLPLHWSYCLPHDMLSAVVNSSVVKKYSTITYLLPVWLKVRHTQLPTKL